MGQITIKRINVRELLFLFSLSIVVLCSYLTANVDLIAYCILFLLFDGIWYILKSGLNSSITIAAFFVTFFTFLLTRIIFPLFFDTSDLALELGETIFNDEINLKVNLQLYIALLSVYLGYRLTPLKTINSINPFFENHGVVRVRKISKKAIYFFSIFVLVGLYDQIRYVKTNSYADYYLFYSPQVPYIFVFLASFFEYFFYFYMATMPSKKDSKYVIILYLVVNLLSLSSGQRGGAVLAIIFLVTYFFIRNRVNPGEKPWITKRGIIILSTLIPIFVSILFMIAFIRSDKDVDYKGSSNLVVSFFYQQGVSANVIGYVNYFDEKLPKGKVYSIGKIIDFMNHNIISQKLFGTGPVKPQTVEHAMKDHTLHATLTYMGSPNLYLAGGGYGGSFIADLWADMGFFGIILGGLIYGICLAIIIKWCSLSFWKASVGLMMYSNIIYAPRSNYIDFIYYVFVSFTAIIVFAFIYCVKNNWRS